MKLLGFCDWYSEIIDYKGKQFEVHSFSKEYDIIKKNEEYKLAAEKLEVTRINAWKLLEKVFLEKGWKFPGNEYQDYLIPVILDDEGIAWKICIGQRSWGNFMYVLECKRKGIEPNDEMGYMDWYIQYGKNYNEKPKYPKKNWMLATLKYESVDEDIC